MPSTPRSRPTRTLTAGLLAAGLLLPAAAGPAPASAPAAPAPSAPTTAPAVLPRAACLDLRAPATYEESFLARPQAGRLVVEGGFAPHLQDFVRRLCAQRDARAARALVERSSAGLWRLAVDRAQGRVRIGTLPAADDRPLYWTRLAAAAALRRWQPSFRLEAAARQALVDRLDRVSRGQEDLRFPAGGGRRVLVTGFDPFRLDRDVRQANPSGVGALALDGTTIATKTGPARVEAALLPVRWRDFGAGAVERTLLPALTGPRRADVLTTVSQGRPGRFDLEATNGAWRAGSPDNEGVCHRGTVPLAPGVPHPAAQPQWTSSTLPVTAMTGAAGAYPVVHNREVAELPAGTPPEPTTTTCPAAPSPGTVRPDGPTPGSVARAGGGGTYLSNEVAYRATLLRDVLGRRMPAGHVHTPVLDGLPADPDALTSPAFERNRAAILAQLRALVARAAGS